MGVMERLAQTDTIFMSRRTYQQLARGADIDARIEAALYRADVPEKYFKSLVPQLRNVQRTALNSALLLYAGLSEDPKLLEELRVQLIPQLARLANEHGGIVHTNSAYVDEVVEQALIPTQDDRPMIKTGRIKERHASERKIIYGRADAEITYGSRGSGYANIKRNDSVERAPYGRLVRKAQELVDAVNARNWRKATERFHDLTQMPGHLFYEAQTYRQFLHDVGSIILQRSDAFAIGLEGVEKYGFPTRYAVAQPQRTQKPKEDEITVDKLKEQKDTFVRNGFHTFRNDGPTNSHSTSLPDPMRIVRRPHPKLERVIAGIRI